MGKITIAGNAAGGERSRGVAQGVARRVERVEATPDRQPGAVPRSAGMGCSELPALPEGFERMPNGDERPSFDAMYAAIEELRAAGYEFAAQAIDFLYVTLAVDDHDRRPGRRPAQGTWLAAHVAAELVRRGWVPLAREAIDAAAAVVYRRDPDPHVFDRIRKAYNKLKSGRSALSMQVSRKYLEDARACAAVSRSAACREAAGMNK